MAKKKVLICDDEVEYAQDWTRALNKTLRKYCPEYEATFLSKEILTQSIRDLAQRHTGNTITENEFDSADVLVVDYRLEYLDGEAGFITGEEIARLARIHSKCGIIIVLNERPYGDGRFDLTFKGYPHSFADLHVNSSHLHAPGLWKDIHIDNLIFRPWTWPHIPTAVSKYENRIKELQGSMNENILEYFQFTTDWPLLPENIRSFISEAKDTPITFTDFVTGSPNAKRSAKDIYQEEAQPRIAAARIHHWLERMILPLQEILIDAPHLAARYPGILKDNAKIESWNETAKLAGTTTDMRWVSAKSRSAIKALQFEKSNWLTRPVWRGLRLRDEKTLIDARASIEDKPIPFVFCEDISQFMNSDFAQWISADIPSSNRMRWIVRKDALTNRKFKKLKEELDKIPYEPALKLAY